VKAIAVVLVLGACTADVEIITEDQGATSGASVETSARGLTGCQGHASTSIPGDHEYVITTVGGPGDAQPMSCGGYANGTSWYAASRQRYGCGSHIKVEANGKCVVVQTDDYGPDVCVENAAHMPIIDVSPLVSKALFGESGAGWSDHMVVTVTEVADTTPLGLCQADPGPSTSTSCASSTLDRDVSSGTCVQSADDGAMYQCNAGSWVARSGTTGCTATYAWCNSATLGKNVPPRTCVQAASNNVWYQCNGQGWVTPVSVAAGTGPIGDCSSMNEL
jgi:hypothetical protein